MKKHLTQILSVLFAAVLLASCGGNNGSSQTGSQTAGEDNANAPKTLKIMGAVDTEIWETRETQPVWQEFQKRLEEAGLQLELEAIAEEQYQQIIQTRTAAAMDLPDLLNLYKLDDATAVNLGESGIFQDVIPLVEQYSNGNIKALQEEYFPNFWGSSVTEDGKAYWFPMWYKATYDGNQPYSSVLTPLVRVDWLDKLGLEKPETADEFVEALTQMREQDVNGNGKQDEVMLYTPGFNYFGPFFGLPSDHIAIDVSDDTAKSPWLMKDQLIPYIQFLQKLVSNQVLDVDSLDKPTDYTLKKVKSNQVSCQMGYANTNFYNADVAEYEGDYQGVIFQGGDNELYVQGELPDFVQGKMAITKSCKDPEAAVRFLDLISTPEFAILHRYGLEGDQHTINEDGVLVPSDRLNTRDYDLEGHAVGHSMWANIIGSLALEEWETLRIPFENEPAILDMGDNHSTGDHNYYYNNYQLAMMTPEELETESQYWTDLQTYMNETITRLALGQYSIDDLDQYIDKMKELGLEKMVAVYQARHDRYIGK